MVGLVSLGVFCGFVEWWGLRVVTEVGVGAVEHLFVVVR
jgi:hypothetical protein